MHFLHYTLFSDEAMLESNENPYIKSLTRCCFLPTEGAFKRLPFQFACSHRDEGRHLDECVFHILRLCKKKPGTPVVQHLASNNIQHNRVLVHPCTSSILCVVSWLTGGTARKHVITAQPVAS